MSSLVCRHPDECEVSVADVQRFCCVVYNIFLWVLAAKFRPQIKHDSFKR